MTKFSTIFMLLILLGLAKVAESQSTDQVFKVGIKEAPPFVIKSPDNQWTGISVDLWKRIAKKNNFQYQFQEQKLQGIFAGIQNGSLDFGIGALTITPEREQLIDFSHSFYSTGLGIATSKTNDVSLNQVLKNLISFDFIKVLALLITIILIFGSLIWLVERRKNSSQFDNGAFKGIGSGFWWSAVTMTTVGYGDKAPVTFLGRLVAVVWMFAGIIIISSFTAAIAASLTVNQLGTTVRSENDLAKVRVATIKSSSSEAYLKQKQINYTEYEQLSEALQDLKNKKLDALVYDAPILKYYINEKHQDSLLVLPQIVQKQDYGIALSANIAIRETINQTLLNETRTPEWKQILFDYLGN
jgi:ABC-type amino acid transport substrate-binding protein